MAEQVHEKWVRFGRELRRVRSSSGMTQRRLAGRLALHYTMLGKIERAERTPQREHAEELDAILETGGTFSRLWQEASRQGNVPDWFKSVLAIERRAQEIRAYESTVVPGILQIAEYTRALAEDRMITATPEEIGEIVETRSKRLGAVLEQGRPLMWFIVKEAVLLDVVGSERIMHRELGHMAELSESGVIRLQLLPVDARTSIGLCLPFWMYRLDQTRTIAYAEHAKGGEVVDTPAEVEEFRTLFGQLQAESLPPSQSVTSIRKIMENRYGDVEEEQL
ncbi:helix-turn-helix domain-containing protein [Nocardiopsis potens]|uniref:helix-turn-helix domain-containing protein n=1 Tax=Nocardiopsis potens TaxID=1246458 RepID=UPI000345FEB2|nr:helix-turn-helix transcriptional regulator [Nocardiopsis potens]